MGLRAARVRAPKHTVATMRIDRRSLAVASIILTYAALTLLAFKVFIPLLSNTWYADRSPEARRFYEVSSQLKKFERELQAVALRDSIATLLPEELTVIVAAPPSLTRARRTELDTAVRAEVAVAQPRATIALVVFPYAYAQHPERLTENTAGGTFLFAGGTDRPFCAVAVRLRPPPNDSLLMPSDGFGSELGPCALWGRYGEPGAGIRPWLERGGYDFATRPAGSVTKDDKVSPALFIGRHVGYGFHSVLAEACLAGRIDACANSLMVRVPSDVATPAPGSYYLGWKASRVFGDEHSLLFELENEFGRERFERFWKSDADFHAAFRNAFGTTSGEWLHRHITARHGGIRAGPAVSAGSIALTLLTIGLLIGVTVMIAQRRFVA